MPSQKKKESEDLSSDDSCCDVLSESDLAEFRPKERNLEKEKKLLNNLPSQKGRKEKDDRAVESMKNDLFEGGTFTREEVLKARKEGDLEPGWKERAEKRKLLGMGEGKEERGHTKKQKEQRAELFAGGSGKQERLKKMKEKEARRKRNEEEKKKKQRELYADAELGVGGIDEDVGTVGMKHVIVFDSDESDEDYMNEEQKVRKRRLEAEKEEIEKKEAEEVEEAKEGIKKGKKGKKKKKKEKEKKEKKKGKVEEKEEKIELKGDKQKEKEEQKEKQKEKEKELLFTKEEDKEIIDSGAKTKKKGEVMGIGGGEKGGAGGAGGAGARGEKKKKKTIHEIDIFDNDAWDALMSKPLSCTTVKKGAASHPSPDELDDEIL